MRQYTIPFLFLILSSSFYAQTGPGGVGTNDGASTLELWLKGDDGVEEAIGDPAESGDAVSRWLDRSGNGINCSVNSTCTAPAFTISGGISYVDFSGATTACLRNGTTGPISGTGARSMIVVAKPTSLTAATSNCAIGIAPNSAAGAGYHLFLEGVGASNGLACRVQGNRVMNYTTSTVNPTIFQIANGASENVSTTDFYTNGTAQTTQVSVTAAALNSDNSGYLLGCYSAAASATPHATTPYPYDGNLYEVIVFSEELGLAKRTIIDNYLAAKLGITLTANDKYAYETTHKYEVAGIGYEGATDKNTAAQSGDFLKVSNASSLDVAGDYLIFGHDNGNAIAWTTVEEPNVGVNSKRIAREWRLDESGTVGTITIGTLAASLPALPAGYTNYVIWLDADGDFSSGATQYPLVLNGSYYENTAVTFTDGDYVTIGCIKPIIQFAAAASSGSEATSPANISVTLNYALGTNTTVDYVVNGASTATGGGTDYTLASGTATITAGSISVNISPTINNDGVVESSETIVIDISNPSAGVVLGTFVQHIYQINDNDGTRDIQFNATSSSAAESVTPLTLTLEIVNGASAGTQTVDYAVNLVSSTATGGGTDYTLANGTATITAPATTTTIVIPINDDALNEANETILIELSNASAGLNIGTQDKYTYTIIDNDAMPTIAFTATTSNGLESVTPVNLQLTLSASSGRDVTVDYAVNIASTAVGGGTDYTLANGTATITAGVTAVNISPTINDDGVAEISETIVLVISNPIFATLGGNTTHTYTIIDNDSDGYSGPGGVGKDDGTSTLKLWLKADDGVEEAINDPAESGDAVSRWLDKSGNGINCAVNSTCTAPAFTISAGVSFVNFGGSTTACLRNATTGPISGTGARSMIVVAKPSSLSASISNCAVTIASSTGAGAGYHLFLEGVGASFGLACRVSGNRVMNYTTSTANPTIFQVANGASENVTATDFYTNGTAQTTEVSNTPNALNTNGTGYLLGNHSSAANAVPNTTYPYNGNLYEVIVFSEELGLAKRTIIDNYLAAKLGITLTSNDKYAFETTHPYEVAGIGCESISDFDNDAKGSGYVRINTPSSLEPNDYLLWGHDNASILLANTTDVPAGIDNRLNRVWRADKTNDVGTVTVMFDMTGIAFSSVNDLELLIDANGVFAAGATRYVVGRSYSAPFVSFTLVNFTDGDYFTLGSTNASSVLLPIELISFTAKPQSKKVNLSWITASEINNDYFTIERSKDGFNFTPLLTQKGAGNSSVKLEYSAVDNNPYAGVSYYRLKQTDFDGQFSYSKVVPVELTENLTEDFVFFPNPAYPDDRIQLKINASDDKSILVVVVDMTGKEVYSKIMIVEKGDNEVLAIDANHQLSSGLYIIIATSDNSIYNQKLIIK